MTTPRKPPVPARRCRECGAIFQPLNHQHYLCSDKCRASRKRNRERGRDRRKVVTYVAPESPHWQERGKRAESHVDCYNYATCLSVAAKALQASVPCVGCAQYVAKDIRTDGPIAALSTPRVGVDGCGEGNRRKGPR